MAVHSQLDGVTGATGLCACLQDHLRSEMQLDGELVFTVRPGEPRRLTVAQVGAAECSRRTNSAASFFRLCRKAGCMPQGQLHAELCATPWCTHEWAASLCCGAVQVAALSAEEFKRLQHEYVMAFAEQLLLRAAPLHTPTADDERLVRLAGRWHVTAQCAAARWGQQAP